MTKKRLTKAEQIKLRDESYRPPVLNERRCETCRFAWRPSDGYVNITCQAIEVRGRMLAYPVHRLGSCDLWQGKEAKE